MVLFDEIQREHFQRIDRHLNALLNGACGALEKMLRNSDWRARDAALGHIFSIHGKAEGKRLGRPRLDAETEGKVKDQLAGQVPIRKVALALGIAPGSVLRIKKTMATG